MKYDFLKNKTVLVTGGTGSFGKNFAKFLLENTKIKKLIIFSRDELKQSQVAREITDPRLRLFMGDVRDLQRLQRAFHGVDIVVHAAALKQAPTLETNPFEAVKTNVLGSQNVVDAAIDQGVEKVVLVSTDKAAYPANLYGSTKLCAEKLFVNGNVYSGGKTKMSCVRYGNVLGSRGSVIETLMKNPDQETVYLTHEDMTRFWITLEQSFDLVLFALANMQGGETFIPKIPSMKILDVFNVLAPKAKVKIMGIRSGEKLHEILLTKEEATHALELPNHFIILDENPPSQKHFEQHHKAGKKIVGNFVYTSDANTDWLSKKQFADLVKTKVILA